ncbi:MAG: hypothetical protein ACYDHM_08925 [Acidiferrobacterales bacterium]
MSHVAFSNLGADPSTGDTQVRIRDARSWVAALPLADSVTSAERLYRALSDLNRQDLKVSQRLDLMELYAPPLAAVSAALQASWVYLRLPMPPRARRLAEFLRTLHGEMACGYQCALRDLFKGHHPWDRKPVVCLAAARAIHQLGEVLLRSYQVYMPVPAGVWRDIHGLYRLIEERGLLDYPLGRASGDSGHRLTVRNTYLRVLLLGLCGPYQLPQNGCLRVNALLLNWSHKASIALRPEKANPEGCFLVNLSADSPARPIPRDEKPAAGPDLRVLDTFGLARAVHGLVQQPPDGALLHNPGIGFDLTESGCLDVFRLMVRSWGAGACRLYPRHRVRGTEMSLCIGLKALHFFSSGRKPFAPPAVERDSGGLAVWNRESGRREPDVAFIDLDSSAVSPGMEAPNPAPQQAVEQRHETYEWTIRDESAGGLALMHRGGSAVVAVGDLLGIFGPGAGSWSVGVVRWLKSPDTSCVEIGVKMLAPGVVPVAVKPADGAVSSDFVQALQLAAIPPAGLPPTLLVERGLTSVGKDLLLVDRQDGGGPGRVRVQKVIRRTRSFEQVVSCRS